MTHPGVQPLPNGGSRCPGSCRCSVPRALLLWLLATELVRAVPVQAQPVPIQLGHARLFNEHRELRLDVLWPNTNLVYELQSTRALQATSRWERLQLGFVGQTNFVVPPGAASPLFLRLRVPALVGPESLVLPEDTGRSLASVSIQATAAPPVRLSLAVSNGVIEVNDLQPDLVVTAPTRSACVLEGSLDALRTALPHLGYRPVTNYFGSDVLIVTLSIRETGGAVIDSVVVPIEITPVNDPPEAFPDHFATPADTTLIIPAPGVLANDRDVEGSALSATLVQPPGHGTLALDSDGGFVYEPEPGYTGRDRFTYQASDGTDPSLETEVNLFISAAPGRPALWLVNPTNGASVAYNFVQPLEVFADDPDSRIIRVEYYVDDEFIGEADTFPFGLAWRPRVIGTQRLTAKALTFRGDRIESPEVRCVVDPDCNGDGVSDPVEVALGKDPCEAQTPGTILLGCLGGAVQSGWPSTLSAVTIRLQATDREGVPVVGMGIQLEAIEGDPRLASSPDGPWAGALSLATDTNGMAVARLWFPSRPGTMGLIQARGTARPDIPTLTIVATALPPPVGQVFDDVPVALAAGGAHSLALLADGTLRAWGDNTAGQLGPGIDPGKIPFSASPIVVPAATNIMAIAAGTWHSMALRADGTVQTWGSYRELIPAMTPAGISNAIGIAAGLGHSLALLHSGTVRAWGDPFTHFTPPAGLADVKAIAAGRGFSLALRQDGALVAWGLGPLDRDAGQLRIPPLIGPARAMAAGGEHALALLTNDTVVAWGANEHGQCDVPPDLTNVVAVAAGNDCSLALRRNGTFVAWGDTTWGPTDDLSRLDGVTALQIGNGLGGTHSLLLRDNGTVWAWGDNASGQLGDGSQTSGPTPRQVSGLPVSVNLSNAVPFQVYTPLR